VEVTFLVAKVPKCSPDMVSTLDGSGRLKVARFSGSFLSRSIAIPLKIVAFVIHMSFGRAAVQTSRFKKRGPDRPERLSWRSQLLVLKLP
jgi:hypothetical protein